MGKYLYGIINSENKKSFGNIGVGNGEIYSVQFEDVCAVVSDVFENCKIGIEEVKIHDEALRKIMQPRAVIPMSFGIVAKDEEEIRNILKRARMKLKKTLEKIENFNCDRKCVEKYCDKDYEFFCEVILNDMEFIIPLCKDHANKFEFNTLIFLAFF